jgi:hypothetical protein
MSSHGPNYAGTVANDAIGGSTAWNNPTNAQGSGAWNTTNAICYVDKTTSQFLRFTNYGFSIPSGATIDGIEVELARGVSSGTASTISAIMYKAGSQVGTNKSSGTFSAETLGSPTDLWGTSWTAEEINASGFGFGVGAMGGSNGSTIFMSGARITVHYTEAGGGGGGSASSKVIFHPF